MSRKEIARKLVRLAKALTSQDDWVWVRVGDVGDYDKFDDVVDAADSVSYFLEDVEKDDIDWGRNGKLFVEPSFRGRNYISFYWGDDDANFEKDLSSSEKRRVEKILTR